MREPEVVAHYVRWLEAQGWTCTVGPNGDYPDIDATHPEHGRLIVEAKGETSSNGGDVDTGYGQLLRRISHIPASRYALVVPVGKSLAAALRVSPAVRARLGIELHVVEANGTVSIWEQP